MDLKNECEGCKAYTDIKTKGKCSAWNTPRLSNTIKCPCVICLVKSMCVKPCQEFKVYVGEVCKERKKYAVKK